MCNLLYLKKYYCSKLTQNLFCSTGQQNVFISKKLSVLSIVFTYVYTLNNYYNFKVNCLVIEFLA